MAEIGFKPEALAPVKPTSGEGMLVLNFFNDNYPIVREKNGREYIGYGERNDYPEFLIRLFRKSPKHRRITLGKRDLIDGKGLAKRTPQPGGFVDYTDANGQLTGAKKVNPQGESMDDVLKKSCLDIEIHGGFRWLVVWDNFKRICDISHVGFDKIRTGKNKNYFYKRNWLSSKEKEIEYAEFNPQNPVGCQVFAYDEYEPGADVYPLPNYYAAIDYIQADIEVSAHTYGNAQGGFTASKMINLFNGEPDEAGKKKIEKMLTEKFTGKYGKKFLITFEKNKDTAPNIQDLGASDLTKEDFTAVDDLIQQNIFTGHGVTSPLLFGIKTEGQLGGNNELKTAFTLFTNMYAAPKRTELEKIVNQFGTLMGLGNDYYIEPLDPVGVQIDIKDVIESIPVEYVYNYLGIPKELWDGAKVGADKKLIGGDTPPGGGVVDAQQSSQVNSILTNLTPQQHAQVLRVIRDYSKQRSGMNLETAKALLAAGYGFSDDQINKLLGVVNNGQQFKRTDDDVYTAFEAVGELRDDYEIITAKKVCFNLAGAADSEADWLLSFKDISVTATDKTIMDLINKDKLITPETIAKAIKQKPAWVINRIKTLEDRGLLESNNIKVGDDVQVERTVQEQPVKTVGGDGAGPDLNISIKYYYDWKKSIPAGERNTPTHPSRPFCIKMMQLNRMYTRKQIEEISAWLGYSVFDRKGGFWNNDGTIEPECRHNWYSAIVVKKK